MTRNQRRKLAAARKAEKDQRFISAFISQKQEAIVRKNMANPKRPEHTKAGVSPVYRAEHAARAQSISGGRLFETPNEQLGKPGKARIRAHSVYCPTVFNGRCGSEVSGRAVREEMMDKVRGNTKPKSIHSTPGRNGKRLWIVSK